MQIEEYLVEDQETLEEMEARLETLDSTFKSQSSAANSYINTVKSSLECGDIVTGRAFAIQADEAIESMKKTWQLWQKLHDEIKEKQKEIMNRLDIVMMTRMKESI